MNIERNYSVRIAVILTVAGLLVVALAVVLWLKRDKPVITKLEGIEIALADRECSCLLPDGDVIYVGGADGLYLLDSKTLAFIKKVEIPGGPILQLVSALYKMPDGSLWVAHNRGISMLQNREWKTFGLADGLLDLRANCFYQGDGGLWAGTWGGAYFFAETNGVYSIQKAYTTDNGLTDNMINVIYSEKDGTLWFGAYYHTDTPCGLSILNEGRFSYLSVLDGLPHSFITSICAIPNGEYYIGCGFLERGGLAVVQKQENNYSVDRIYGMNEGLPGPKVRTLYYDTAEHLWIATENDGILIVSNPSPNDANLSGIYIKQENGLPDNEIKQIMEHDGYIYLAARRGIARLPISNLDSLVNRRLVQQETNLITHHS
ncbi:MAG: hypothetical protein FWC47_11995 [Oscillospiraceae bacterium]|nr:hypothetical protein [Oscillospiraceae bacterium]